jgi:cell fate (sporulation/competence/biofilm development) regulator YlbF (YheA/YmcA/DUF963 family)
MPLTEEIKAAARQLGQSLRQDDYVRAYLNAWKDAESDPEVSALEKKMHEVYEELIAYQQEGQGLGEGGTGAYLEIHREVQDHPLIAKRNDALRRVRPRLAAIADEISLALGVDYTRFAKPE